ADERRAVVVLEQVARAAFEIVLKTILAAAKGRERNNFYQSGVATELLQRIDAGRAEIEIEGDLLRVVGHQTCCVLQVGPHRIGDHEIYFAGRIAVRGEQRIEVSKVNIPRLPPVLRSKILRRQ